MPERNHVAWGALISAYANHGRLKEAKDLFDAMDKPNVYIYTSMVAAYAKAGEIDNAERIYNQMPEKDVVAQTTMLQAFAHNGCVEKARKIFDSIPDKDETAWNTMITAYAQNYQIHQAKEIFDSMPAKKRNTIAWNSMLSGFNLNGCVDQSLKLLEAMKIEASSVQPNEITFIAALSACADAGALETGRALHSEINAKALEGDGRIRVSLINMYGKCRSLVDAIAVFDQRLASLRDAVCWTAMVTAYADNHRSLEAIQALARMDLDGVEANHVTFVGLVNGIAALDEAKLIYAEIVQACLHSHKLDTALVHMFSRCGSMLAAEAVFQQIPAVYKDIACFDAMISAYEKGGEFRAAVRTFELMILDGVAAVDEIVFITVLSACSHSGMLARGLELFWIMQDGFGLQPSVDHFVCLVDLLGRSGPLQIARELIESMPFEASSVPWTILLDACNKVGSGCRELASVAAEKTIQLEPETSASYVLSSFSSTSRHLFNE